MGMTPEEAAPVLKKLADRLKLADEINIRAEMKMADAPDGPDSIFANQVPNGRCVVVISWYESSLDRTGELPEGEGV